MDMNEMNNELSTDSYIFDVIESDFQTKVMDASQTTPVILDCHASWCEPCKQLMPILESVVTAHKGAIKLAKFDIEKNKNLASQMQVKSVPAVMVVYKGQPIDGFQGLIPKSQLEELVNKVLQETGSLPPIGDDAPNIVQWIEDAETAIATGDYDTALPLWMQILEIEPTSPLATAGLAKCYINMGQYDAAKDMLESSTYQDNQDIIDAIKMLEISVNAQGLGSVDDLQSAYESNPDNLENGLIFAQSLFGNSKHQQAVDLLLELYKKDKSWNDEAIKKELLKCFEVLGFDNPISIAGRKKLSSLMFI